MTTARTGFHRSAVLVIALLTLGLGRLAPRAAAHPLLQDSMWVLFEPERVRVAVNVSVRELSIARNLDASRNDQLATEAAAHADYVKQHLRLTAGRRTLVGELQKITPPPEIADHEKTFFQYELDYPLSGEAPAEVAFSQTMLREFSYAPGEPWDVTYALRIKRAGSPELETGLLRAGQSIEFSTGFQTPVQASTTRSFGQYFTGGVMHILTGYDHLLFVSALVLATITFWEMVKVIAAFTLAHTLTLALSALDLFRLPSWFVEPVIAASIVFVAVENIVWPGRIHSRLRLAVAFGFGLVHGLGFAGGLLEAMAGLPTVSLGLAILAFSLGVEIGHQIVVLPLFGVLRLGQRKWEGRFRFLVLRYGSGAISLCGVYYFIHALTSA